jgi:hypothetical protein
MRRVWKSCGRFVHFLWDRLARKFFFADRVRHFLVGGAARALSRVVSLDRR